MIVPPDGSVEPATPDLRIVALVASAGGLEAVSCVLGGLPASFAAAVIVLIHQMPDRTSRLAPILSRNTKLPTAAAVDGAALCSGTVIVAPPGKHVLITPSLRARLIDSGPVPPSRPSADLLLATLAVSAGRRAIAVVLSGGGHDGATGATAIHACGGVVIASDRATSQNFAMPMATISRDDAIDHVVPLDEIADRLVGLVGAPALPGSAA